MPEAVPGHPQPQPLVVRGMHFEVRSVTACHPRRCLWQPCEHNVWLDSGVLGAAPFSQSAPTSLAQRLPWAVANVMPPSCVLCFRSRIQLCHAGVAAGKHRRPGEC